MELSEIYRKLAKTPYEGMHVSHQSRQRIYLHDPTHRRPRCWISKRKLNAGDYDHGPYIRLSDGSIISRSEWEPLW